jgi:hypothetical protein
VKVGLVLLKSLIELKLHYILQFLDKYQFIQTFIIQGNSLFREPDNPDMVGLPHFAYHPKSDTDVGP